MSHSLTVRSASRHSALAGACWTVLERGEETLRALLSDSRALPLQQLTELLHAVLCAVAYLHCHSMVHLDLKPEKFMRFPPAPDHWCRAAPVDDRLGLTLFHSGCALPGCSPGCGDGGCSGCCTRARCT